MTDPISDFLTRIRNAAKARHALVEIPANNVKKSITKILYEQGYILNYRFDPTETGQDVIRIALKYDNETGQPVIKHLSRFSRPGLRKYAHSTEIPRVVNGLGIAIVSTSHGIMTDKSARQNNVGGEVLCFIY